MLLSQELMELGRTANPKSNMSQGTVAEKMLTKLKSAVTNHTPKQLLNITKLVCDTLNKEGYNYFKVDIFFLQLGGKR